MAQIWGHGKTIEDNALRRNYPFTVLPTQLFKTTNAVVSLQAPLVKLVTGVAESNKVYEGLVERCGENTNNAVLPLGPGGREGFEYPTSFDCFMGTNGLDDTVLDSTAFIGIEINTLNSSTLATGIGCAAHLKMFLKNQNLGMFSVYMGNSVPVVNYAFTLPTNGSGHRFRIFVDPPNAVIKAYVDNQLVAQHYIGKTVNDFLSNANNTLGTAGILYFSGVQTGTSGLVAYWMAAEVCSYGTHSTLEYPPGLYS